MEPVPPPINRSMNRPAGPIVQPGDGSVAGKIAPAPPTVPNAGAFTPEHLHQIATAKRASTKIRRAIGVAKFSGVTTAVFAVITLVCSLTSPVGFLLGMGMAIVSIFEFRGAAGLTRLDSKAPKQLAINQIAFALMLAAYGAISFYQFKTGPPIFSDSSSEIGSDPEIRRMLSDSSSMIEYAIGAIYLSIIAVAIVGPGLTAVYYYTRAKFIEQYVTQTPAWILELQRAGMSL